MNTYTTYLKIFLCFAFGITIAQPKDIKVGLILSGGGAKGMAHVGVLKEIERAGVRIDYIGGTSMGAIVGGLDTFAGPLECMAAYSPQYDKLLYHVSIGWRF